jgi:hypothetical protein
MSNATTFYTMTDNEISKEVIRRARRNPGSVHSRAAIYAAIDTAKRLRGPQPILLGLPGKVGPDSKKEVRLKEIEAEVEHIQATYSGCDWCCGGGDQAMVDLTKEWKDLTGEEAPF